MWLAALMACGGTPLQNDPPILIRLNGETIRTTPTSGGEPDGYAQLPVVLEPGGTLPLTVEVEDPEGDPVAVWFPLAPGTVAFDPLGREGTWHLPNRAPDGSWTVIPVLQVVVGDPDEPSRRRWYQYELFNEAGATY